MADPTIIVSPLSGPFSEGGITVDVQIYRLEDTEWTLWGRFSFAGHRASNAQKKKPLGDEPGTLSFGVTPRGAGLSRTELLCFRHHFSKSEGKPVARDTDPLHREKDKHRNMRIVGTGTGGLDDEMRLPCKSM